MSDVLEQAIGELAAYLKKEVGGLRSVRESWPAPGETLVMPCLAVIEKSPPTLQRYPPYEWKGARGAVQTIPQTAGPDQKRIATRYVVGQYDFELALHLWTATKPDRHEYYDRIFRALMLNTEQGSVLNLELPRYYGARASYALDSVTYGEQEEAAQRNEWRAVITVLASCKAIVAKTESAILESDVQLSLTETELSLE